MINTNRPCRKKKKEKSIPWYNDEYKEAKKLMSRARKQFIYALKLFDTLVTPISEYDIELWGFKGLGQLKKSNLHFYKFITRVKQSTADNSVYRKLGRWPSQFRLRWKHVKFWNKLTGLPQ